MKKKYSLLLLLLIMLMQCKSFAQLPQLIGATKFGGTNNYGIFYKINFDGSGFTPIYSFEYSSHRPEEGKMVFANNLLFGITSGVSAMIGENVFSFNPVSGAYKIVHQFSYTEGMFSDGGLTVTNNGLIYGTTYNSGIGIFSYDPLLDTFKLLLSSNNTTVGNHPACTMVQAADGKLYGTTLYGGTYNNGVIFSFDIHNNTYTKEYDFNHAINPLLTKPRGGLTVAGGLIYGFSGFDANGKALIYSFNISTKALSVIHQFPANYFKNPDTQPALTLDFFGTKLYGVTSGCCSPQQNQKIFYINILDKSYHESFTFTGTGGDSPIGSLLNYNANHFYGITTKGGSSNFGVLYQYYASALGGFIKEHDFTGGAGGSMPVSNLTYVSCTAKPAKPQSISGSTTVTCNKKKIYSTNRVSGATSYIWTVPDGATIKGPKNDTAIAVLWGTQGGNVSVQASNDCGRSSKRSITVAVSCNGKESATAGKEFVSAANVFPNPTTGNITLNFYSENASKYMLRIADITGRILLTREINATAGENSAPLDLHKLAKGIYRLELTGNDDSKFFKVAVQ